MPFDEHRPLFFVFKLYVIQHSNSTLKRIKIGSWGGEKKSDIAVVCGSPKSPNTETDTCYIWSIRISRRGERDKQQNVRKGPWLGRADDNEKKKRLGNTTLYLGVELQRMCMFNFINTTKEFYKVVIF